jgi:hypothetical protein
MDTIQEENKTTKEGPKIMKTVWPDQPLSQPEWLRYVKAGIMVKDRTPIQRANDMMRQYQSEDDWLDKFIRTVTG